MRDISLKPHPPHGTRDYEAARQRGQTAATSIKSGKLSESKQTIVDDAGDEAEPEARGRSHGTLHECFRMRTSIPCPTRDP